MKSFVLVFVLLVAGCGAGLKKSLGIDKKGPDESKVSTRKPLHVPPHFSLVPPKDTSHVKKTKPSTEAADAEQD
jgi:hypothetical protein